MEAEPAAQAKGASPFLDKAVAFQAARRAGLNLEPAVGLGCFLDPLSAILLLTPLLIPLVKAVGIDTVHFGIVFTVNLAIGLYTPPVGTTLFITSAVAKVKVGETVRELGPFYLVAFVVLALVSYVPALIFK